MVDLPLLRYSWEGLFYGGHRQEEEETDEYVVVYSDPGDLDFTPGLYIAEIRNFHVTAKQLPGGQAKAGHHRNQ